ncbi:unnamed protein product [Cylicocyclus nassatus]|uniref:Uncharacterized protein n=1 Tax=Cylicocyclus nassatus TaxID=53992 RepID=A0AA36DTX1_CYLNA|nr:unnamed protein product [Cylicocyclus nassatus]
MRSNMGNLRRKTQKEAMLIIVCAQRVSHLGADSFSFACGKSQIPSKVSVAHSPFFQASNWSAMYVRICS